MNISGLFYIQNYITSERELELINIIDSQVWLLELKRRVQHYGYKYDYRNRSLDAKHYIGPIPKWLSDLCQKLYTDKIFTSYPDQVIINEYLPGQGISAHIDCVPCFGKIVSSLSLCSPCVMDFTRDGSKESILLEPRSLCILRDDARYLWKHGIPARKSDEYSSVKMTRSRRLSLTFRTVIL